MLRLRNAAGECVSKCSRSDPNSEPNAGSLSGATLRVHAGSGRLWFEHAVSTIAARELARSGGSAISGAAATASRSSEVASFERSELMSARAKEGAAGPVRALIASWNCWAGIESTRECIELPPKKAFSDNYLGGTSH